MTSTGSAVLDRRAVALASVLTLAMACSTFLSAAISVLAPFLVADLEVSRAALGWLFTAWAGVGAVGSLVAGHTTDRIGGRRVLSGLFVVVAICTVGVAVAPSYGWVFIAVLFAGIANAAGNPATNKVISLHTAIGRRGMIIGVKQSGVAVGAVFAGAVLPFGAVTIGWRPTLALTALLSLAALLATLRVIPPDPRDAVGDGKRVTRTRQPTVIRWIALYGFLMGAGGAVIFAYLPLYAYEDVGLSATAAGAAAAVLGLVAVVARFVWGWRAERVSDFSVPLGLLALASLVAAVMIWQSANVGAWLLWVGAVAAGASVAAWNAVGMLAVVLLTDTANAGRASGLVLLGFLGGYTLSPVLFGYAADLTGAYDLGWAVTVVVLGSAVLVTWLWRRSPGNAQIRMA